jgi:hypothetical protein
MLLRWDIENPGQLRPFLTPEPQWNGCTYTDSYALPTARTQENGRDRPGELVGDFKAKEDFQKDNNAAGLLCAAGAKDACSGGSTTAGTATTATTAGTGGGGTTADSTTGTATPDVTPAVSSGPADTSLTSDDGKSKKKRGKKRGGRSRGGRGKDQSASLQQ